MNIEEAVNQLLEKLRRHLESLEQERNTLPGDNYLWGNWREDEKILSFEEGALETTEYTNREMPLDAKDIDVPTNRWISVKDKLPRCGDRVIMTDGVFVCEAFLSISGKWVRNGIGWIASEITHWMPMPSTEGIEDDT